MGIQSFKFPIDFLNNIETPVIYIAKKDKTIVNSVSVYDGLKLTFNLNAFQTAEFKIYRDIDGKPQDYFNDFEEEMLVMIPGISWYEIHVETNIEQTGISKSITATSLECKLCDKRLIDFECNAGEILYDDYVKTIFFDPSNPKGSLLHRVLNVSPNWTVGHVDDSLANKQRTFDIDDIDVYSFLTGDVSEAFNCLFIFDTFNCTVNAYDLDNYGSDTSIFVSMDNLAQNMKETIDQNSIFTCYRVNGGDGIYINEVNPNGTNKIYNFEYYLPQMSPELRNKVIAYNNKYQTLKPQYEDIMLRMQTQVDTIQELYTRLPESFASKDWTQYGLSFLESKQKSFKTQDELYCAQGMNKPQSLSYNLYKQNLQDLNDVTAELNVRQSEIDSATALYNSIKAERNALQEQLDMDNWFTVDEWKSLDNYVIEATYDNDNYIVTDLENDSERLEIERQLYDVAWKDLSKKCRPQYQYSTTLANILTIPEFKDFVKYFELGNFIRMQTDYDTIVKLRIINFTLDYTNTQTIEVTFSDAIRVKDIYDDTSSIQAQANSVAMSFQFNKDQYDKTVKQGNFVAEMRKYGLDVATTAIHNSKNQSQVWDESGMTFRMWNEERKDFDPEQIKIINNQIVFSDDGFNTVRMALGKIALGDNEYGYGLNAEILMSKLVMSQNLWIENDSGTYKFDDAGFIASNGKNTIKIQPNNSGELFSIYKDSNKQFYINSDGDMEYAGTLRGATGIFSGLISGGEININNTFTVDKNGNLYSSSGTFAGLVSGGSININNVFQVDKYGKMTATSCNITGNISSSNITSSSATFGGITLNSYGLSSKQFSIDSYGNASFSGTLSATSITSSGALNDYLTSSDLGVSGTTSIDGGRITTGTISADRIDVDNLVATRGNFTKEFNVRIEAITDFYNGITCDKDGTKIFYFSKSSGRRSYVHVKDDLIDIVSQNGLGRIEFNADVATLNGSQIINSADLARALGDYVVPSDLKDYLKTSSLSTELGKITSNVNFYATPYITKHSSYLAREDWCNNKFATKSSDKRLKNRINILSDICDFYMNLLPVEFYFNSDLKEYPTNKQYGLLAQDVKNNLELHNCFDSGIVKLYKPYKEFNENLYVNDMVYKIDYNQFHAFHIAMIQKHEREIVELKQQIEKLKEIYQNNGKTE